MDLIQEVHLWDFTRDHVDKKYLKILEKSHARYKLFGFHNSSELLTEENRLSRWLSYYEHYSAPSSSSSSSPLSDDDILIKCDDDIVYLSLASFQQYLSLIRSSSSSPGPPSQCNLFFPNIVNNDVCAYIQTNYSVHDLLPHHDINPEYLVYAYPDPLTGYTQHVSWFLNSEKALDIHHDFLSNPDKYHSMPSSPDLIPWNSRISINFFGATGRNIRHSYRLLLENSRDDERYLTSDILPLLNKSNCIVPSFVVSHYSFQGQRNGYRESNLRELLPSYYQLMINRTTPLLPHRYGERVISDLPHDLKPRRPRSRSNESAFAFYKETYSPRLLMDDPDEDEMEKWSEELKLKMYSGFGFDQEDYALLDSLLGSGFLMTEKNHTPDRDDPSASCPLS
jgi:hypothetical protein